MCLQVIVCSMKSHHKVDMLAKHTMVDLHQWAQNGE